MWTSYTLIREVKIDFWDFDSIALRRGIRLILMPNSWQKDVGLRTGITSFEAGGIITAAIPWNIVIILYTFYSRRYSQWPCINRRAVTLNCASSFATKHFRVCRERNRLTCNFFQFIETIFLLLASAELVGCRCESIVCFCPSDNRIHRGEILSQVKRDNRL